MPEKYGCLRLEKPVLELKQTQVEQNRITSKLHRSEARFKNLVGMLPEAIFETNQDFELTFVNQRGVELFGYSEEDLKQGVNFFELILPEDRDRLNFNMARQVNGKQSESSEYQALKKDGTIFPICVHANHIIENETLLGLRGIVVDMSERKLAQKALKVSHERFLTVLNSIDATVYVVNMETYEILFMNQHMIECFGRDMTGDICWKVFRGESGPCRYCKNDQLIDENGTPSGVSIWKDTNPITGKFYMNHDRAIEWTDGTFVKLQVATDITDLKKMEEELRQVHKMESIGVLAAGIAHDFNNILSGIFGYSQLAEMHMNEPKKAMKYVGQINKGAQRASELVQQILTFSRQSEYKKQILNVSVLLKEALKLLRSSIPSNIEIKEEVFSKATVMADPIQTHQVIMNLCTNAYHAMSDTGGVLTVRLDEVENSDQAISQDCNMVAEKYLRLEVSDSGHGMNKEVLGKIFDPYFTTKKMGKGTGLGLSVVKGIIRDHNGFIRASSDVGYGSRFQVFLPIIEHESPPVLLEKKKTDQFMGTEHIMLVDDETDILDTLELLLQRQGYKITIFQDGVSALQAFISDPDQFDLIITDMAMPRMAGDELSLAVLNIRKGMPIILCTGYHENFTEDMIYGMGIRKYVQKPIAARDLCGLIREVLDEKNIDQ